MPRKSFRPRCCLDSSTSSSSLNSPFGCKTSTSPSICPRPCSMYEYTKEWDILPDEIGHFPSPEEEDQRTAQPSLSLGLFCADEVCLAVLCLSVACRSLFPVVSLGILFHFYYNIARRNYYTKFLYYGSTRILVSQKNVPPD